MASDPVATSAGARPLHRLEFLARAGELLASSLDYEATLRHVARLALPELGDLCVIDVMQDGALRRLAAEHVRDDMHPLMDALAAIEASPATGAAPAAQAVASGRTARIDVLTDALIDHHTRDEAHARLIRAIGIRSVLVLPMRAHDEVVGVMSLGITDSDRRYGDEDQTLGEELARRAALAVANARLYAAAQAEIARRERAEAALRLSEQRFRAIMEQSPLSTQRLARDGTTIGVNRAWEQLWAIDPASLGDYSVLADPQLEAAGVAPLLRRAFAGESVHLPVIAYDPSVTRPLTEHRDDPVRWIGAYAYPVRDDDGEIREVVLVHEDVTDARRAERELRASEERLNRVLVAGGIVVWDWDLATGGVHCSANAREFFGVDVGQRDAFMRTIHPHDLPRLEAYSRTALETGTFDLLEYRLRPAGSSERWVQTRGQVAFGADGRPARMLGVTVDVTERHRAESLTRLLAEAGEVLGGSLDYATTLDNLAHVVVPQVADWFAVDLLTDDGELERVAVYHPDAARVEIARQLFERYPPRRGAGSWKVIETREPEWLEDLPEALIEAGAIDAEHARLLIGLQLRSYIIVPLIARDAVIGVMTLVQAESGRQYRAADVAFAMELARRAAVAVDNARLHRQLQEEHRRKDEFLATLAHELRNPLAPLRTGLALLNASDDARVTAQARRVMERQLGHMVRLIDDLLDLSRVTRGAVVLQRRIVTVGDIVDAAIEASGPALEAARLTMAYDVDPGLAIDGDDTRLAQVLTNLLNNAAKFTPAGGRVAVSARRDDARVRIVVEDTGIGLDGQQCERIFEMFVRGGDSAAQGGLGIGLTLARRLAELHGGRLWAESEGPGRGSRFIVELPLVASPAGDTAAPCADAAAPGARRVLVVDDNADAAQTLATLLELDGHDVRSAGSGDEALAVVDGFVPDVAFLDIGLPGMDGYELATHLRRDPRTAATRLVALTGWGRDEDRLRSHDAGFDAHLTKPVDPAAVLALLAG